MLPETWLPTWTVMTAFRFPVVVTVESMSPRSTRAVAYSGGRGMAGVAESAAAAR